MDYSYIIIPIIVVIASQAIKLLTDKIKGNFDLKNLFQSYGGMPSSHTAFAVSMTTLIGLQLGFDAPIFALALVLTLIIINDALVFRNFLGRQATRLNQLIKKSPTGAIRDLPPLREQMGHSGLEVLAGAVWGIVITYFLNLLR